MKGAILRSIAIFLLLWTAGGIAGCVEKQPSRPPGVDPVIGASVLYDGSDFEHWTDEKGGPVPWRIFNGAMEVVPRSGSIVTKETFGDVRLHIEFNVPKMPADVKGQGRGNSGIYFQGRYEVQILDSYGLESKTGDCGAIYGVKVPDKNVCKKPNQWQSYDITFIAPRYAGEGPSAKKIKNARITVFQNGVLIHENVEVPNSTRSGRPEGIQPGPILLQNHGNKVKFRNIWVERLD